ncbi:MAG: M20/M25/M40 family metallo-hydrolase [Planctomycetes bacterium]|nr:M20/M25/M40 family metallo-hydrolase [Planctomycetota bacterium]
MEFLRSHHAMSKLTILAPAALALAAMQGRAPATDSRAAAERMRADLTYLASDELQGREAGTENANRAAAFVQKQFTDMGLAPGGDGGSYYQIFKLPPARRVVENKSVAQSIQTKDAADAPLLKELKNITLVPTLASSVESAAGRLVDVGDASAEQFEKDAWKQSGSKIAIARMTVAPEGAAANPHGFGSGLRTLAFSVKQHGAKGLICIVRSEKDIQPESGESHDAGLPIVYAVDSDALGDALPKLLAIKNEIAIDPGVEHVERKTQNVIGLLAAPDPKADIIVIGGHYDHLGWGGSDSLAPGVRAIHHGADDNASGTTMVLELARRFAARRAELKRSILFVTWGAEEMGLLGSDYFVKHPTQPMERIAANLNFDMVGRSKERKLTIMGSGSSPEFEGVVEGENAKLQNPLSLSVAKTLTTLGGSSDHRSFIVASKPALFFFTGTHSDYHKPTDTVDKIEFGTMAEIADLSEKILWHFDLEPKPITWANLPMEPSPAATPGNEKGAETGLRAWLGTIPEYGTDDIKGVLLSGTSKGSPAEKAGLLAKDILIQVGEFKIDNINDLTIALGRVKPGQEVEVAYVRAGDTKKIKLTIAARR